jgi:protocatechuate 3,4-dioxygenase beta subunit
MTNWIEPLALWLADFYLAATILLAAAAVLLAVVKQPARRMAVAWGTLCGLLLAAVLCQSASRPRLALRQFLSSREDKVAEVHTSEIPQPSAPIVMPADRARDDERERLRSDVFEPLQMPVEQPAQVATPSATAVPNDPDPAARGQRPVAGIVWFFLAGSLLMGARLSVGVLRAFHLVRQSEPTSGICLDVLRAIIGPAASAPRLRINRRLLMPVATGALQPAILLPEEFARSSRALELKAVLAHEWAHIRNGDLWLLALDRLVLTLMWAHPLYWWTRWRLRADQELLADAAAASQMGAADYAALLVEWARHVAGQRGLLPSTAVGIWERRAGLAERVTAILHQSEGMSLRCSGRVRAAVLVYLAGLSLAAASLSVRPPLAESAPPQAPSDNRAELDKPVAGKIADTAKIVDYQVGKDEIGGLCLGRGESRLSGVAVSLYLESFVRRGERKHDLLGRTATNEQGQFVFTHVRPLDSGELRSGERYVIVGRRKGLATEVSTLNHSHDWVDLKMANAVPVRGTVKDEQGKPVAGALVRCNDNAWRSLSEGVHSARTDALGQFQIDDVADLWGCVIEHPVYAPRVIYGPNIKLPLEVTLIKGSVVEGQVVDGETGRPGHGLSLSMQAVARPYHGQKFLFAEDPELFSAQAQTDGDGRYRFARVPAGRFHVYLTSEVPDRASVALDSLEVPASATVQAPAIRLVKGGVVHGRLIDDLSGKPALLGEDERIAVTAYGPSRPHSGPGVRAVQGFPVNRDGTFEMRLPPGKNFVLVSGRPYVVDKPADPNAYQDVREIEIKEGQETTIEFRFVRLIPKKEKAAVTPKAPASADANAAKPEWFHVRGADLGGAWYDAAGHPIAGAKLTLVSTDAEGSKRKVLKETTTNSWGQFLFVCAPCLADPNQHYELVLSRESETPEVRKTVHPGEFLDLRTVRQVPMREDPEKTTNKLPATSNETASRSATVAVAEVPSVSPKIVDYRLEKESVGGLCLGRNEVRRAGVEVTLYIIGRRDREHRFIGRTITNDAGQFLFQHVPQLRSRDELYLFIAKKKGLAIAEGELRQRHDWVNIGIGPGVSMNGVVRDEQGKPIAGALVRGWSDWSYAVPDAAPSVRTNERGEFQIDDLERFGACSVSHPDYLSEGLGSERSNPVELRLRKASVVRGQVTDSETGRPVAGARVTMQRLGHVGESFEPRGGGRASHGRTVTTDLEGRYQFRSLGPGAFTLYFRDGSGGVASASIDKASVGPRETLEVPPVRLAKGANVTVRLIDNEMNRLVYMEADETVVIGIRSADGGAEAAKPRLETLHMRDDGTIGVWLPAGKHALSLAGGPYFSIGDVPEGIGHDIREVEIKGGEEPTVVFRVVRIAGGGSASLRAGRRG